MADRFWVGGTDTWNSTAGTKWSTTTGGTGGAAAPTSADTAIFDANSGSGTVTVSGNVPCLGLAMANFTGTLSNTIATDTIEVYGSITFGSGMTISVNDLTIVLNTTTTATIDTNGKNLSNLNFELDCTGIVATVNNAIVGVNDFRFTQGTFNLPVYGVTANYKLFEKVVAKI